MRRKLSWIDVLNEQSGWRDRADFSAWFASLIGRNASLLDGAVDGFDEALLFMRTEFTHVYFDEPVDLMWIDTQLKTVNLGLIHNQGAQEGAESQLPRFRARVKGMQDSDLLRAVKDTLLIQFAEFIGTALDQEHCPVRRCEGISHTLKIHDTHLGGNGRGTGYAHAGGNGRGTGYAHAGGNGHTGGNGHVAGIVAAANVLLPPDLELKWRNELPLLAAHPEDLQRCANVFYAGGKTRFCSDACRFATVQIAKQVEEPEGSAKKPRRFRRQQEQQQV